MPNFKITCERCGDITRGSAPLVDADGSAIPDLVSTTPHCNWCMTLEECDAEIKKVMNGKEGLPLDDPKRIALRHAIELEEARIQLRHLCEEFGDNSFSDDLHLGDAIEKYLGKYLHDRFDTDTDTGLTLGVVWVDGTCSSCGYQVLETKSQDPRYAYKNWCSNPDCVHHTVHHCREDQFFSYYEPKDTDADADATATNS